MDTSRLPGGSTPAIRTMHLTELKGERADGGGSGREARSWGREGERAGLADFGSRPRGIIGKEGN